MDFSGLRIDDLHGLSGIVNEELLSGPIFLTEAGIELFGPLVVAATKLTVLVSLRTLLLVFMPEKLKGHSFLLQLLMERLHRRHLALFSGDQRDNRKKSMLQSGLIHLRRKRPTQPNLLNTVKIVSDRPSPHVEASSNLTG
jgi:hypothetical protein